MGAPPAPGAPRSSGGRGKGGGVASRNKGGGRGLSAKRRLAGLVTKLDVLTKKALSVSLNDGQKTELRAQVEGLQSASELSEAEARARLNAIHRILQGQRFALESAGYAWPAPPSPGGGFPRNPPSPFAFKGSAEATHFESLLSAVGAGPETPPQ